MIKTVSIDEYKALRRKSGTDRLEILMLDLLGFGAFTGAGQRAGVARPEQQHRFDADRRWSFDFAWPNQKVAVEIEGGTHVRGRHTRAAGYRGDCDKYNAAQLQGWLVLRYTADHFKKCRALMLAEISEALNRKDAKDAKKKDVER